MVPDNSESAVILGATSLRLLLALEDTIRLLEAYTPRKDMLPKDAMWLEDQKRFANMLRESNPRE